MTNSEVNASSSIYGYSKPVESDSEAPFSGASALPRRPYSIIMEKADIAIDDGGVVNR